MPNWLSNPRHSSFIWHKLISIEDVFIETINYPYRSLSFFLFLDVVFGGSVAEYIGHKCFKQLEFSADKSYVIKLNGLLQQLSEKYSHGYQSGIRYSKSTYIHGLSQCWSNSSRSVCRSCIRLAIQTIRILCLKKKGVIIWYDDCSLKYSNEHFLARSDTVNGIFVMNRTLPDHPLLLLS